MSRYELFDALVFGGLGLMGVGSLVGILVLVFG